ncbi:UNVERIFIED_CONTAM: hypothetical protein Sindi_1819500 [Sesamum indicum]
MEENVKADCLSKLASALENCRTRQITIQYLPKLRALIHIQAISSLGDWRTPVIRWLEEGHLPNNRWDAARLRTRAARFLLQEGVLYKKSFIHPLLRCLSQLEGLHILKEIHSGCWERIRGNLDSRQQNIAGGIFLAFHETRSETAGEQM